MTKKEQFEIYEEQMYTYSGILFHNQNFEEGNGDTLCYNLDCPEYVQLREQYSLEKIAGRGSDFDRSKRLMHYFAPRIVHSSWYDNHVPCNALDLLEYSLNNPEQGINCVNKAKILEECCLALGIYARRMFIMPFSPYDFDNHVVTEIYDRERAKWIMLDPTTDGFFVDEEKQPLSLLEIRDRFANDRFLTFVRSAESLKDLSKLREKHMDVNMYICKNLFYFAADKVCGFGGSNQDLWFCPENYSMKRNRIGNTRFRINHVPEEYKEYTDVWEKELDEIQKEEERILTNIQRLQAAPCE